MDSLDEDWLSVELEASSKEVAEWTGGLRESYESLLEDEAKKALGEDEQV